MSGNPAQQRIFLVGFMGSGKTSVGRALAGRLGIEFFDTDAWIEARESRSVAEIFRESGEAYFREREAEAVEEACRLSSVVVASGGGIFAREELRERLRARGISVWLDTPLERIWERCRESEGRPLWGTRDDLAELLERRRDSYRQADWRIETADRGVEEIAREIERLVARRREKA